MAAPSSNVDERLYSGAQGNNESTNGENIRATEERRATELRAQTASAIAERKTEMAATAASAAGPAAATALRTASALQQGDILEVGRQAGKSLLWWVLGGIIFSSVGFWILVALASLLLLFSAGSALCSLPHASYFCG